MKLIDGLKSLRLKELHYIMRILGIPISEQDSRETQEMQVHHELTSKNLFEVHWDKLPEVVREIMELVTDCGGSIRRNLLEQKFGKIRLLPRNYWDQASFHPTGIAAAVYRGYLFPVIRHDDERPAAYYCVPDEILESFHRFRRQCDTPVIEQSHPPFKSFCVPFIIISDMYALYQYVERNLPAVTRKAFLGKPERESLLRELFIPAVLPPTSWFHPELYTQFLFHLCLRRRLIEKQSNTWHPNPDNRLWFEGNAQDLIRELWVWYRETDDWDDLYSIPDMRFECTGHRNAPSTIRAALLRMISSLPANQWFSLEEFLQVFTEWNPTFLRPLMDHENWTVTSEQDNSKLVEGELENALIRFILTNPFFWLGITAIGSTENGLWDCVRISGPGHCLIHDLSLSDHVGEYRNDRFHIHANFEIVLPRDIDLHVRFKVEDIAGLQSTGHASIYSITKFTVWNSVEKGWTFEKITQFLDAHTFGTVPQNVRFSIQEWCELYGKTKISRVCHLETETPAILTELLADNEFSATLIKQLSDHDVTFSETNLEKMKNILINHNIPPHITEFTITDMTDTSDTPDDMLNALKTTLIKYLKNAPNIPEKQKLVIEKTIAGLTMFDILTGYNGSQPDADSSSETALTSKILPLQMIYRRIQKSIKEKLPIIVQVLSLPDNQIRHHKMIPHRLERIGKNAHLYGTCLWTGKFIQLSMAKILRVSIIKSDDS